MAIEGTTASFEPRIKLGMVGGGSGAFIGAVHRIAARIDDKYELVAGALSSTPEKARQSGAELGLDPSRIYVAGLSAGASMALALAHGYPDLFAAVGAHSGLPLGAARDQTSAVMAMQRGNPGARLVRAMPTIVFHGSHDAVVHPRNGRLIAIRAREPYAGLRQSQVAGHSPGGRSYAKTIDRVGAGRALVEHWSVRGAGHAWSGGSARGRFTDPKGPDASREMLRFFLRHSLAARRRKALAAELQAPAA